jgi:predicted ATPase
MNDEQRNAAIEARARTQTAAQNTRQNTNQAANTGLTGLVMGQQGRMGGVRMNTRQTAVQDRSFTAPIVMRNLWFIGSEGRLEVMRVQTGISNGSFTEIISMEDLEGRQVILRERI